MRVFILLSAIATILISSSDCSPKNDTRTKYKGRLEIKGICLNYTIKLLEGKIDTSLIATEWTDESSGKTYTNVFGLADPCRFPKTLNQGDEFYFAIDTVKPEDCIMCQAYYPTPLRRLIIKVLDK